MDSLNKKHKVKVFFGYFFLVFSVYAFLACLSYFFTFKKDYLAVQVSNNVVLHGNFMGKLGAYLGYVFLSGFGVSCFLLFYYLFSLGFRIIFSKIISKFKLIDLLFYSFLLMTLFGFLNKYMPFLGGFAGVQMNNFFSLYLGKVGLIIFLIFSLIVFLLFRFEITVKELKSLNIKEKKIVDIMLSFFIKKDEDIKETIEFESIEKEESIENNFIIEDNFLENFKKEGILDIQDIETDDDNFKIEIKKEKLIYKKEETELKDSISMDILNIDEELLTKKEAENLVREQGFYDPKLDLSHYKYPPLNLLEDRKEEINIDRQELEDNKNQIIDTLKNYKIDILSIKATVGPTVTLYEIVPAPGIRISKIQSLENDIALSLSALGIRIIAPMPGKGTIGIEVPNSKPSIVSMKSVLLSKKFQDNNMDLPIAFGKTITNETFIADLAKMPHLLMAGATGQGKSVGLNAILTSLLYKKHPAEVKFVLVDPKKVELALFNKIERHFLAKLPGEGDPIITDTSKVVNTLNSLCLEMDQRYDLLKDAGVRNIKEYNGKFIERKLSPSEGHRFLPYIVLVVDEFADLIMTAGKEIEMPIARLAQLARAIGIHLIIATQRPSVNVITGIIKANFPARIAFRVTSKIDSRTILDMSGADQLIGKGDMLFSTGNDLMRIQCAFIETLEVENIADFIGSQQGYPTALWLPEYESEEEPNNLIFNKDEKDIMFEEAARLVVATQQGSTSLIQRKLKLGYNRSGRIIDQLEAFGIVGPFEGSKARQVLIQDENTLDKILRERL